MNTFRQFDRDRREIERQSNFRLMWAYGSNLCVRQMARRCPDARKVKALPVYGAKLVFRGVADVQITDNPADVALGGLWRISRRDEDNLDRYEGVKSGLYTKEYFFIRDQSRHYHKVLYYKMASDGIFPPDELYLDCIVQGYMDFGLDMTKLDAAVRHSWDDKNKTEDMRQRFLRHRPVLAKSIEKAKRPMITEKSPPKAPQRQLPLRPPATGYSAGMPSSSLPKHQPSWPSLGPHSKLLPKPAAERKPANPAAPPLESLFPQEGKLNPSPQESAEAMKRAFRDKCCGAFNAGGPLCPDCPATTLDDFKVSGTGPDEQPPHGED